MKRMSNSIGGLLIKSLHMSTSSLLQLTSVPLLKCIPQQDAAPGLMSSSSGARGSFGHSPGFFIPAFRGAVLPGVSGLRNRALRAGTGAM